MENIIKIIDDLQNDTSRNGKEAILKANKDNQLFREILRFVYNPFIVTGLSTKKINKKVYFETMCADHDFEKIEDVLNYLKKNNTGRDYDIFVVQRFINFIGKLFNDETKEIVKQIVTKDLKVGVTSNTINKVYGKGEIPSFGVMLAESYAKKEDKVNGKFFTTLKLDGNRCVAINDEDGVKFFSRKGQPIEGMTQLEQEFANLPKGIVYDGEVLLVNKDNLPSDELFRATQKVVRKDGEKKNLEFHVFDALPIKEFTDGKSKKIYEQRRNSLELLFNGVELQFVKLLPILYSGTDKNSISELMIWAEENNYEGLMLNTANGLYVTKRTDNLLKVKKFKTADLLCVSVEEGTGKNVGKLGRINVEYKGGLTGVGSGFSDEQREYFWNNKDEIIGKVIEVKYFEESQDENGNISLRFPIFRAVRTDKGVEDINYDE